jgi:mannitol/fructose-specific phosphotransferase system IIA component (Ntr-type)
VVAICLLDEPVDWDGIPVRAVFLFSITKDGGKAVREFDRSMASLLMDERAISDLLADQRFATLLNLLENLGDSTDDDRCTPVQETFPGT